MTIRPLGDSAWLVEFGNLEAHAAWPRVLGLAEALQRHRPAEVEDVVSSFASLAVRVRGPGAEAVRAWIARTTFADRFPDGAAVEIPVCYGGECGPDLADVSRLTGLAPEEIVAAHHGAEYTVAAVGFAPGFPYLAGLPEALRVPRRETPRLAVPAGSVAIAGGQAGIYTFASPGGWQVIGRTGAPLFDPQKSPPALLKPGDRVRFVPVESLPATPRETAVSALPASPAWIEVLDPGGRTSVQDSGRPGWETAGVSPGGAADARSLRLANLLVGNAASAAGLEFCVRGAVLKFHGAATVALAAGMAKSRPVADGETVDFSKLPSGVRACLAIAGGILVPPVLGSAATDSQAGFGGFSGRCLRAGDRLPVGAPGRIPASGGWHAGRPDVRGGIVLRFLRGVQAEWFSENARETFASAIFQVTPDSDRMGARLSGPPLRLAEPREMLSQPVACGSVQVPPDGQPIVLLAGRQTIGGYPQVGHVITVDLPKLARAWPGTAVRFREVSWDAARAALRREELAFARLRAGLDLLKCPR
jgi:KipI family sensor histidine kinase inhibitor